MLFQYHPKKDISRSDIESSSCVLENPHSFPVFFLYFLFHKKGDSQKPCAYLFDREREARSICLLVCANEKEEKVLGTTFFSFLSPI